VKVTQLDSSVEEVTLQEIQLRKAFRSSNAFDQQVFYYIQHCVKLKIFQTTIILPFFYRAKKWSKASEKVFYILISYISVFFAPQ
jgi:hypothetical protein